jgi:hypothetical protein
LSEEYRESGEDIAMQYNKYKVWNNLIKIRSLLDALLAYSITSIHATFHIRSCQGSYFQPTNQQWAYQLISGHMLRAVLWLVSVSNCRLYDWTVKDEWKISTDIALCMNVVRC